MDKKTDTENVPQSMPNGLRIKNISRNCDNLFNIIASVLNEDVSSLRNKVADYLEANPKEDASTQNIRKSGDVGVEIMQQAIDRQIIVIYSDSTTLDMPIPADNEPIFIYYDKRNYYECTYEKNPKEILMEIRAKLQQSQTKSIVTPLEKYLNDSRYKILLQVYSKASSSNIPVFFYKLRHRDVIGGNEARYFNYENDEQLKYAKEQGVIYDPPDKKHSWLVNLAWVFGIVEKSRIIIINTPISKYYIFREGIANKNLNNFSAFAREIAVVIKAGYQIEIFEECRLKLIPPINPLNCILDEIDSTIEDTQIAIRKILHSLLKQICIFNGVDDLASFITNCRESFPDKFYVDDYRDDKLPFYKISTTAINIDINEFDFAEILNFFNVLSENGFIYQEKNKFKLKRIVNLNGDQVSERLDT